METKEKKILDCFIIMPFESVEEKNSQKTLKKEDLTYIYEKYFLKALHSFKHTNYTIRGQRQNDATGNFVKAIVNKLNTSDFVLADLTGLNPNVMYELGIRHTLKDNTIMVCQNIDLIPSDLRSYITTNYEYKAPSTFAENFLEFEKKLHIAIKERLENLNTSDNPVRDFIEIRKIFKNEEEIKNLERILKLTYLCQAVFSEFLFLFFQFLYSILPEKSSPYVDTNLFEYLFHTVIECNNKKIKKLANSLYDFYRCLSLLKTNQKVILGQKKNGHSPEEILERLKIRTDMYSLPHIIEGNTISFIDVAKIYQQSKNDFGSFSKNLLETYNFGFVQFSSMLMIEIKKLKE